MQEAESYYVARRKLTKASDGEIYKLRNKILSLPAEFSWLNKAIEAALVAEIFYRSGVVDKSLYSRVIYTVESVEILGELKPINQLRSLYSPLDSQNKNSRILFLSSKYKDFVSSQETTFELLRSMSESCEVVLASKSPIIDRYLRLFDCHRFETVGELRKLCKELKVDQVVDLSMDHAQILSPISKEVLVADVWGSGISGPSHMESIAWPELVKYHEFLSCVRSKSDTACIFLPPESNIRKYPPIVPRSSWQRPEDLVFGAFCRTAKLNIKVVSLWAELLNRHPGSVIHFAFIQSNGQAAEAVKKIFLTFGIQSQRIIMWPRMNTRRYLECLNAVDINLGAMPEQGGISCLDSIIMGCPYPVCNDFSNTFTSSIILQKLQLTDWIAGSKESYLALCDRLVAQRKHTGTLEFRSQIRERLLQSSLSSCATVASVWKKFLLGK